MGKRTHHHPQALQDRLYEASKRPNPWKPTHRYRIVLRTRDGRSEPRGAEDTLEAARAAVARFFEFDVDDELHGAWIEEQLVL